METKLQLNINGKPYLLECTINPKSDPYEAMSFETRTRLCDGNFDDINRLMDYKHVDGYLICNNRIRSVKLKITNAVQGSSYSSEDSYCLAVIEFTEQGG